MNDAVDQNLSPAQVPASSANPDLRWYIVHAYSGMEKAVERNITERINARACKTSLAGFSSRRKKSWK